MFDPPRGALTVLVSHVIMQRKSRLSPHFWRRFMEARMSVTYDRNQVRTGITCVLAFLFFVPSVFAQEWVKYRNDRDAFEMEVPPGQTVRVTETTYESW